MACRRSSAMRRCRRRRSMFKPRNSGCFERPLLSIGVLVRTAQQNDAKGVIRSESAVNFAGSLRNEIALWQCGVPQKTGPQGRVSAVGKVGRQPAFVVKTPCTCRGRESSVDSYQILEKECDAFGSGSRQDQGRRSKNLAPGDSRARCLVVPRGGLLRLGH